MAQLQYVENPTVVVVPPPDRSGRYLPEVRTPRQKTRCGHRTLQALLWLIFVEHGLESGREVTDVICSTCEPARFARVASWAEALQHSKESAE
jgi:hypothetical protein